MKRTYSIYPTLLNSWHLYLTEAGYSRGDGEGDDEYVCFVPDEQAVLNYINRVPTPQTEAQRKGQLFEDAVLGRVPVPAGAEERSVMETRKHLPPFYRDDVLTAGRYNVNGAEVVIYGKIDVIGAGAVVDIKTTSKYSLNKYLNSHQLFYLHNTAHIGINRMAFVINENNHIHLERYRMNDVDWSLLEGEIGLFIDFLEEHRERITDTKIFTDIAQHGSFSLRAFGYDHRIKQIGSV